MPCRTGGLAGAGKRGKPVGGEAAEDEDDLRGDGVDALADARVVEEQIEELRYFEVIDGDGDFISAGDDEVGLDGSGRAEVPCGDPIDAAGGEIGSVEFGIDEAGEL